MTDKKALDVYQDDEINIATYDESGLNDIIDDQDDNGVNNNEEDDNEEGDERDEDETNANEEEENIRLCIVIKEREVLCYRSGERIRVFDVIRKGQDQAIIHRIVINSRDHVLRPDEFDGRRKSSHRSARVLASGRVQYQWDLSHWGEVVRERLISAREAVLHPQEYDKWARTTQPGSGAPVTKPAQQPIWLSAKTQPNFSKLTTLIGTRQEGTLVGDINSNISLLQTGSTIQSGDANSRTGDTLADKYQKVDILDDQLHSSRKQICSLELESNLHNTHTPGHINKTLRNNHLPQQSSEVYHLASKSSLTPVSGNCNSSGETSGIDNSKFLTVTPVDTSRGRQKLTHSSTGLNSPHNSRIFPIVDTDDPLSVIASKQHVYAERLRDAIDFGMNVSIPSWKSHTKRLDLTVAGAASHNVSGVTQCSPTIHLSNPLKSCSGTKLDIYNPVAVNKHSDSDQSNSLSTNTVGLHPFNYLQQKSKTSTDLRRKMITGSEQLLQIRVGNSSNSTIACSDRRPANPISVDSIPQCLMLLNSLSNK